MAPPIWNSNPKLTSNLRSLITIHQTPLSLYLPLAINVDVAFSMQHTTCQLFLRSHIIERKKTMDDAHTLLSYHSLTGDWATSLIFSSLDSVFCIHLNPYLKCLFLSAHFIPNSANELDILHLKFRFCNIYLVPSNVYEQCCGIKYVSRCHLLTILFSA